jgi:hypothetical protein
MIEEQGHAAAIILEDDCELRPNAREVLIKALKDLKTVDPMWEVLFMGNFDILPEMFVGSNVSLNLYKPRLTLGLHGYVVSRQGVKTLLNLLPLAKYHVDVVLASQSLRKYGTRPMVAFQSPALGQSSQLHSSFPTTLNSVFGNVKYSNFGLSYILSSPIIQIGGVPIIPYIVILYIILALIPSSSLTYLVVTVWFFIESLLNNDISGRIAIYWLVAMAFLLAK